MLVSLRTSGSLRPVASRIRASTGERVCMVERRWVERSCHVMSCRWGLLLLEQRIWIFIVTPHAIGVLMKVF